MREPSSACSSLHYRYHTTVRGSLAPSHLFVCSLRTCSILLWPGRQSQPIYLAFHFFINCSDILTLLTIFLVKRLVLGAQKERTSNDDRLPITVPMLHRLYDSVPHITRSAYSATLVRAMFLTMFHTFLRNGEVTASRNNILLVQISVQRACVVIVFL